MSISATSPKASRSPINPAFGAAFINGGAASATSTSHVTDNIVRVGLN